MPGTYRTRIYMSLVHTDSFRQTPICAHSTQRVNCRSLIVIVAFLFFIKLLLTNPVQFSVCTHSNHLYSRNRNWGSISSWRRLFNRNENLRLSLTRYLAIASLRERLKHLIYIIDFFLIFFKVKFRLRIFYFYLPGYFQKLTNHRWVTARVSSLNIVHEMTREDIVYQTHFNIIAKTNNANGLKPSRTIVFDYAKANGEYHWVIVVPLTTNSHCTRIVGEIYIWLSWRLRSRKLASEGTGCIGVSKRNLFLFFALLEINKISFSNKRHSRTAWVDNEFLVSDSDTI